MVEVPNIARDGLAGEDGSEPLIVNKRELATEILSCSTPTIDALIRRYPDFPIEQRGTNGIAWRFDAGAVVSFLREKRNADRRAGAGREALFEQFRLPLDEMDAPEVQGYSPAQRLALAKAIEIERKNALAAGKLAEVDKLSEAFRLVVTRLGKMLDSIPGQLSRELELTDEAVRRLRRKMDDARSLFVRDLQREFGDLDTDFAQGPPAGSDGDSPVDGRAGPKAARSLDSSWTDAEPADMTAEEAGGR